jgi:hypothetical protein
MNHPATMAAKAPAAPRWRGRGALDLLGWIADPVWRHRRALAVLNGLYFGAVALAAIYAMSNPALQASSLEAIGEAFSPSGALGPLVTAYIEGRLGMAIALTFLVNLVLGSFVVLTLPSLVVPFAGLAIGLYRALLWGILFSPSPASALGASTIAALPTILLEGEAYVLAMLGVWVWWSGVVRRRDGRWNAWKAGLRFQARLYPAVAVTLVLAAICEVLSVIFVLS